MINFEVNQQAGKIIPKSSFHQWLNKISKELKFKWPAKVSIAIVGNQTIKKLNQIYRGKNQVTDVLSFSEGDNRRLNLKSSTPIYLGEVIICYQQAVKQAKQNGQTVFKELELLFIHGILHLLGYDHEKPRQTGVMRRLEQKILAKSRL